MKTVDVQLLLVQELPALLTLHEDLTGTRVSGVKPGDMGTTPVVLVLSTGGSGWHDRILTTTQITFDCYAGTPWLAGELARSVISALHQLVVMVNPITNVQTWEPSELPDPDAVDLARYTVTAQITTRLSGG